jgi:PAS domain S-box-containing protein
MILDQEKMNRIKKLLKSRPKGLTISEISQILKFNRNSTAKYLEILLITGQVEMRAYGNAKVFYITQRVPISSMLKFATEMIMVIDIDHKITEVNDNLLNFYSVDREELLGATLAEIAIPPFDKPEIQNLMTDTPSLEEPTKEIEFSFNGTEYYFRVKIIPTVFDDGGRGFTFIIEDITREKLVEERLRINEARIRAIVDTQTEMINRFRTDFSITFVNAAVTNLLGLNEESILGRNLMDFIVPEEREMVAAGLKNMTQKNPILTIENRVPLPNGQIRWTEWTNRAIFDGKGNLIEYQGVGRDVTEQKKAKEELLIKEKAIADSTNGIAITDIDGIVTYVNSAFLSIFGIKDRGEVVNHSIFDLVHTKKETRDIIREAASIVREKGKWVSMHSSSRTDGKDIDLIVSAALIKDENGRPLCMMGTILDITENIKAEREIKILDTAIASSNNGIAVIDPEKDDLIYANNAFLMMNGADQSTDIQGKKIDTLFSHVRYISPTVDEIKERLKDEGSYNGEIRFSLSDGTIKFLQFAANNVLDKTNKTICVVVSTIDITDQKMMEKTIKSTFEKLQETIEFIHDPTFIVDKNRRVIAWNRALEILTGVKKEVVLGKNDYSSAFSAIEKFRPVLIDLLDMPPNELARRYPAVRRFGDSIYLEAFVPCLNDGEGAYIWGKASPLTDGEGNPIGAIESFRDMSEWKRAKESIWNNREKIQTESDESG